MIHIKGHYNSVLCFYLINKIITQVAYCSFVVTKLPSNIKQQWFYKSETAAAYIFKWTKM